MGWPQGGFGARLEALLLRLDLPAPVLAERLGVERGVVASWLAGAARPSMTQLAALTDVAAADVPGFSLLDWDRSDEEFAGIVGGRATPRARPARDSLGGLPFVTPELARAEARRVGQAYPGLYRMWRQSFSNSGQVMLERLAIRRVPGGHLGFRCTDGAFVHHGLVMSLRGLVFLTGEEAERQDSWFQMVLHGVNGPVALRLDGLLLSVAGDRQRTPAAMIVAGEREAAFDPAPEEGWDEAWFAGLRQATLATNRAGTAARDAPAEVIAQIVNRVSPEGPDRVLRLPASRSIARADTDGPPEEAREAG